jgi:hypothetical protein
MTEVLPMTAWVEVAMAVVWGEVKSSVADLQRFSAALSG